MNSFRNVVSRQCKQKPLYTKTRDLHLFYVYFKSFIYYDSKFTTYIKHQDHIAHLTPVCPALIYSSVVVVVISYSVFWKKELFPGDKINCSDFQLWAFTDKQHILHVSCLKDQHSLCDANMWLVSHNHNIFTCTY